MKSALLAGVALMIAAMPLLVWAASNDEEVKPDGRMEGYTQVVITDSGSSLTYLLFVVLLMATAGVTFMNARRSHLD